jgi:hypothetical protein
MNIINGTDVINLDCDKKDINDVDREMISFNINDSRMNENTFPTVIFRFKFTEDFMEELYKFSKIHQYDARKDFKDAWKIWTEENEDIINMEIRRLTILGYEGDILDKMFKSARYYFRKKSSEIKAPKTRRQYISVNKELLNAMDIHIEENVYNSDYQPKTGFVQFCKSNEKLILETITNIYKQNITNSELIEDKLKKTYKNRYFILTNKTS